MKAKLIIAGVIVVAVGAWAFSSFTKSMTSYVTFVEAQKRPERVQVMGSIDHDKAVWDVDKKLLTFPITDTAGVTMLVRYTGTMPAILVRQLMRSALVSLIIRPLRPNSC